MHIPGFLIFLAIVVYWASCMGPQALKWVGILFVSGCLVIVLGIAGLLLYQQHENARREKEQAKADYERLMSTPPAAPVPVDPQEAKAQLLLDLYFPQPAAAPRPVAPLRALTPQEHAILDTLKVERLPRRLPLRDKQEAIRLRRALVRGPLEAENRKRLDLLLQRIAAKTSAPSLPADGVQVTQSPSPPPAVLSQPPLCETQRYLDNGNGTLTDCQTGLMWEKKDVSGGLHTVERTSTWQGAFGWVDALNRERFAQHTDWRLPTIEELQTLVLGVSFPCISGHEARLCIDPLFGPTAADVYRSSTADADDTTKAWVINFHGGSGFVDRKTTPFHLRAVRGALRGSQPGRVRQP